MKILVTGTAGFIGHHAAKKLAQRGDEILGVDNINAYYDVNLKYGRLADAGIDRVKVRYNQPVQSEKFSNYKFFKLDLVDRENVFKLFEAENISKVCHLAAQPGVRYSLENPFAYIDSNIVAFINILEACRQQKIENLVFASSSSVYGLNKEMPFTTLHNVDHPISLYAATKKSMELLAHAYSYLFQIPTTGLRFFTVYGSWGRPDMAVFKFVKNILDDKPIDVYNYGKMERDFTFIDDIVSGVVRTIDNPPLPNQDWNGKNPDPSSSTAPYKLYNIGSGKPISLMDFIKTIEEVTGKKAVMNMLPLQPGDVQATWANCANLEKDLGCIPNTPLKEGIKEFVLWYKKFYNI